MVEKSSMVDEGSASGLHGIKVLSSSLSLRLCNRMWLDTSDGDLLRCDPGPMDTLLVLDMMTIISLHLDPSNM